MSDATSMVKVLSARNNVEARVVAALLESAGIPTHVPGQNLQDEYAMAQNVMGVGAVDVMVPARALDEARGVIAEARARGSLAPPDDDTSPED